MASGYPFVGSKISYVDYLVAGEFVKDMTSASREAGQRLSMDISRQTRAVIASNEALARENIRATEIATGEITGAMRIGFGELSGVMQDGFSQISYEMQEVSAGINELNATFHWGFGQMLASMGRMNDALTELVEIAKTQVQTIAFNHYEIARDAFRRGLYQECLESLDKAISGDHTSPGYKLEWRFHQMKGTLRLGFFGGDMALVDLPAAEESFALAARYAKTDCPDHAAQAFLSAGWAAYLQGKMAEGLAYTEQALLIKPGLGEALFQAAKVRMAMGDVDTALPILGKAIELDRFYALKAAGDGEFQRHDEQLRGFLDAMRQEKYRQAVPKVRGALEEVQKILENSPEGKGNKAVEQLLNFLTAGGNWPLLDMLAVVQGLDWIIAVAKRLPIVITLDVPQSFTCQEQESYEEEVVVKPAGWFSKAVTEMQTRTRTVTKARNNTAPSKLRVDLCAVPAGSFTSFLMCRGNKGCNRPHVTISHDFYLGKFPVTQSQWETIMCSNPSHFKGEHRPVENVSWNDCQEFIKRLNFTSKGTFRLPTAAEWEYACRADSTAANCFGENKLQMNDYAWTSENSDMQTHPVGEKKPNAWGLHDMNGNVCEWCQDWFYEYYEYPTGPLIDPQGAVSGTNRVTFVSCWSVPYEILLGHRLPDYRSDELGFRLVFLPAS